MVQVWALDEKHASFIALLLFLTEMCDFSKEYHLLKPQLSALYKGNNTLPVCYD